MRAPSHEYAGKPHRHLLEGENPYGFEECATD